MPKKDQAGAMNPNHRHGMHKTTIYKRWVGMRARCRNDSHYVKHGITVCPEWDTNFLRFFEDMGDVPFDGATLDRIDGTKGYYPGNVRWATYKEQSANIVFKYVAPKLKEDQAKELGLHVETVRYRVRHGIPLDAPKYGEHRTCRNGHEYTEDNTWINSKGVRKCRTCHRHSVARNRKKRGVNKYEQPK